MINFVWYCITVDLPKAVMNLRKKKIYKRDENSPLLCSLTRYRTVPHGARHPNRLLQAAQHSNKPLVFPGDRVLHDCGLPWNFCFLSVVNQYSVPARLGRGQGAKEIGHNLVSREQPKFGHNLVRKRHKIWHSLECDRWKYKHKFSNYIF